MPTVCDHFFTFTVTLTFTFSMRVFIPSLGHINPGRVGRLLL